MDGRKIIKYALALTGVAIVVGYSYFVLDDFIRGPRIVLLSPENGFSTTTPVIIISGKAIHTNNLTVNDAPTPVDLSGNFSNQLILSPGYNIMKVVAKDNYARVVEKTIEIVLIVPQKEVSATSTPATNITPGCLYGYAFSTVTGERCTNTSTKTGTTTIN